MRQAQQLTTRSDEPEIAPPSIDADRDDAIAMPLHRPPQTFEDFAIKAEQVPK